MQPYTHRSARGFPCFQKRWYGICSVRLYARSPKRGSLFHDPEIWRLPTTQTAYRPTLLRLKSSGRKRMASTGVDPWMGWIRGWQD